MTFIADDHPATKARMEEIKAERLQVAEPEELPEPKAIQSQTYMGWDIYAPVNLNG